MKKLTIFTLLLLSMTTMMSNVAIVTTLPQLKDYFIHINDIEFYSRLMLTLPSLVIAILAPFIGHMIFKFGKKRSTLYALSIFSISGSAGLYLNSIESLLFSRAIFGIGVASLMIVSTSLVGDYFKEHERHRFMGFQSAFTAFGGILFVSGGGYLSDISWRYPFGIYLIGALLLPLVYKYLKEVKITSTNESEEENIAVDSKMFFVYALAFFFMLIFFILPTQIPFLLIETFHTSASTAGMIIAIAFFSNAMGAMFFSKLKVRYSYSTIYLIGLLITGLGFSAIGIVDSVRVFFITSPIVGFGGGIMMTNMTAWMLSKTNLKKRVKTSGYFTSSLFLGQFFSPILFHPIVSRMAVQDFFLLIGVSLMLLVVMSTLYLGTKKRAVLLKNKI